MNFRNIVEEQPGSNKFILCVFIFMKHWKRAHFFIVYSAGKWLPGVKDVEKIEKKHKEICGQVHCTGDHMDV